jgi:hypothetical protein
MLGVLSFVLGCSRGPSRVDAPDIDPADAADQAIDLYDANGDGNLDKSELAKCPGMLSEIASYDKDGSLSISSDEITRRLSELLKYGVGLTSLQCEVRTNGRPLKDAEVVSEPEPYLGEEVIAAKGITNGRGLVQMSIPAEQLPSAQQSLKAIHFGTYKVRINHPKVPAKYNTDTTLGYETRSGDPFATFNLKIP